MSRASPAVWTFLLLLGSAVPAHAGQDASTTAPRVRLIATGGTISSRVDGRLTAAELIDLIPGLDRYARAEFEQFANVSSSALTLQQWLQLSRRVNDVLAQDRDLAGVVVTSGTDTLEETAYFLHLTVHSDRPVVVVGAMRNPSTLGYEGAANLLQAFRVAAAPESRAKGVLVVLNDEINSARDVTKTDALRLHTFQTRSYGILGTVDRDRVVYYRVLLRRHTLDGEFSVSTVDVLPRVDVLMTYQGAPGDLITAAVDAGARGLVIAAAGAGSPSRHQRDALTYAYERGVFVVVGTRTGSGRVAPRRSQGDKPPTREEALRRRYRIAAQDLSPLKARILLMLALTQTDDVAENPADVRGVLNGGGRQGQSYAHLSSSGS